MPGIIEHVVLATGCALIGPSTQPETREPDDLAYPGDQPRALRALLPGTTAVLIQENT